MKNKIYTDTLRDIKLSTLLPIVTLHKFNLNKNQKSFTTFKNLVIVWILKQKGELSEQNNNNVFTRCKNARSFYN